MPSHFTSTPTAWRRALTCALTCATRTAFAVTMCLATGIATATAGMIRDSEIEAGLETLIAPMAAGGRVRAGRDCCADCH